MDISEHCFVRTTSAAHKALVSEVLQSAHDRGDIYKASYRGYYCVGCEKYLDEDEMGPGHTCPTHRTVCKLREEENYFFRLSKCAHRFLCPMYVMQLLLACCKSNCSVQACRDAGTCTATMWHCQQPVEQPCQQTHLLLLQTHMLHAQKLSLPYTGLCAGTSKR